jgi:hypothetical protein
MLNMGRTKGPYNEEYPVGTKVRIANRENLEKFIAEWKLHNPLNFKQLDFANKVAVVEEVGFYHGGDELYKLVDIPGLWHAINLLPINQDNT